MKLDVKALSAAAALLSAAAVLLVGIANLLWPPYAGELLALLSSIYPGYHASGAVGDLIAGIFYALVDGALFGLVFGWLYNRLESRTRQGGTTAESNASPHLAEP